ncbi:MAG: hypothetical protein RIR51_1212 [Bacteroidota bacterium]|jgi:NAD(P)-dependent dehydrogenase (short-subunit alcohol dehydrogenase family)
MKNRFQNKVVIITGAASGIGQATAIKFAQEGAKIVLSDISDLKTTEEKIKNINSSIEFILIKTDISKREEVLNILEKTINTFGKLDLAVNCAGIAGKVSLPIHSYPEEEWIKQIQVNLLGTYYCVKYQIETMLKYGGGNIVCISSAAGLVGQPENSAYSASKHGVNGIVKSAAIEYATQNIRINAICPTAIETPMIMHGRRNLAENPQALEAAKNHQRMKRMGQPEEIADIALWMCSDESSFITGTCLAADGGAFA